MESPVPIEVRNSLGLLSSLNNLAFTFKNKRKYCSEHNITYRCCTPIASVTICVNSTQIKSFLKKQKKK